ncbi:hypothetical protein ES707_19885 [subsurface metagenome]
MPLNISAEKSQGATYSGYRGYYYRIDTQSASHPYRVRRPGATKGVEDELTGVSASLGGNGADCPHHTGIGDTVGSVSRLIRIHIQGKED